MRARLNPRVFLWVFLAAIFLFSRIYRLSSLPLFSDEAYAILRATDLHRGAPLLGMIKFTTQPVFIWLLAIFQYLPFSLVVSARLISASNGLISAGLLAYLAKKYIHPHAAILAFVIAICLPFTVFYDRTVLFESSLLASMLLALVIPPVGVPLAILTKQTGWLILPLAIGLHWRHKRVVIGTLATSIMIPLSIWMLALGNLDLVGEVIFAKTAVSLGATANVVSHLYNGLLRVKLWFVSYITLPFLFLSGLGMALVIADSWRQKKILPLLQVAVWMVAIIIFESATAVIFYPRYLYPVAIGVILLSTKALWTISTYMSLRAPTSCRGVAISSFWLIFLLMGTMLFLPIKRSWTIITNPSQAAIAAEDYFQFYDDWTSGSGSREIASAIALDAGLNSNEIPLVYLEEQNSYAVTLLDDLGRNSVSVTVADWLVDPLSDIPVNVLLQPGNKYVVRNRHPDIPENWPVELIKKIPKSDRRSVYLYRIVKP